MTMKTEQGIESEDKAKKSKAVDEVFPYFATNLRYLRSLKGWNQEEVAMRIDIKRTAYSQYENNNVHPQVKVLHEIAKLYNKTTDELLYCNLAKEFAESNTILLQEKKHLENENEQLRAKYYLQNTLFIKNTKDKSKKLLAKMFAKNLDTLLGLFTPLESIVFDAYFYHDLEPEDILELLPNDFKDLTEIEFLYSSAYDKFGAYLERKDKEFGNSDKNDRHL